MSQESKIPRGNHAAPADQKTEVIPVIKPADQATTPGDAQTEEEVYAALKAKRAERRKKKLIRRGIVAGVVAAVVIIAVIAVTALSAKPEDESKPVTDRVIEGTYLTTVDAKGSLKPISSSVVSPTVDGTIESINVSVGQQVSAGDVLMTIKNDELDRNVADAQRTLRGAQEDLVAAQKAYNNAVNAPKVTDEDGNVQQTDTTSLQNAVSTAQRAVETAQAALDTANGKAAERTVTAPTSGSIVEMNAKVGASVSGGVVIGDGNSQSGKQCMQIADLSQMKVTVQVGEEDIAKVAAGQNANISYPAFTDIMSQGSVTSIGSIASSSSEGSSGSGVTFDVDILISEPDSRLKPGMTAQVSIVTEQLDNVVMVPVEALQTDDGMNYYVNVATDDTGETTRRVNVTVVTKNSDSAVVGKSKAIKDEQGNETNPDIPVTKLKDGQTIVTSAGGSSSDSDGEWTEVDPSQSEAS